MQGEPSPWAILRRCEVRDVDSTDRAETVSTTSTRVLSSALEPGRLESPRTDTNGAYRCDCNVTCGTLSALAARSASAFYFGITLEEALATGNPGRGLVALQVVPEPLQDPPLIVDLVLRLPQAVVFAVVLRAARRSSWRAARC